MDPNDGCTLIVKKEEDCERQKWIQTRGNLSMVEDKKKDSYSRIWIQMERGYPEGLRKAATNPDDGYPERDGGEEATLIIEKLTFSLPQIQMQVFIGPR